MSMAERCVRGFTVQFGLRSREPTHLSLRPVPEKGVNFAASSPLGSVRASGGGAAFARAAAGADGLAPNTSLPAVLFGAGAAAPASLAPAPDVDPPGAPAAATGGGNNTVLPS